MTDWAEIPKAVGAPNFENLLAVLRREVPQRPTLFEFFLNDRLYQRLAPLTASEARSPYAAQRQVLRAYHRLGYDYVTVLIPGFEFTSARTSSHARTVSINEGGLVHDWASFEAYPWPDPEQADYALLDALAQDLPEGMRLIVWGPCGVLENAIKIVGFETLCYLLADDPALVAALCEQIGTRLTRYYEIAAAHPAVGACIDNDDWGFRTQTMLSPRQMRQYIFPWHQRIVEVIHQAGKPVILHSCGYFEHILEDILALGIEGRHSYEDIILPVEEAYERYHKHFAILGGIDMDFLCRATPEAIYARARALLQQTATRGGYALGSGNSIPDYVPDENYFAMIRPALEMRG